MGYPTKVQLIKRKESEQWYINFPAPLARALEFQKGEVIEWIIQDKNTLLLRRTAKAAEARPETRPSGERAIPAGKAPCARAQTAEPRMLSAFMRCS